MSESKRPECRPIWHYRQGGGTDFWCKSCRDNDHQCSFKGKAEEWGVSGLPRLRRTEVGDQRRRILREKRTAEQDKEDRGEDEGGEKPTKQRKEKEKERKKVGGSSGGAMSEESRAREKVSSIRARSPSSSGPSAPGPSFSGPSFSGPSSFSGLLPSTVGGLDLVDLTPFSEVLANQSSNEATLRRAFHKLCRVQDEEQEKMMAMHYELVERSELIDEIVAELEKRLEESRPERLEGGHEM